MTRKKIYYGWLVCITGTLLTFITMGTVSNGFAVFMPYIMDQYGLTHAQTSSLVTIRCLVAFCCMLGIGLYYKKFTLRQGTGIAAICAACSFLIYSAASTYGFFCLGATVSGFGYGFGSMIPASILMNRWFVRRRALALGICASGSGLATIIMAPVTTWLIENLSMSKAFLVEGLFLLGLSAVIILLIRSDPAEKGLLPYGVEDAPAEKAKEAADRRRLSAGQWVLLIAASLMIGGVSTSGYSHLTVLYTGEGFPSMTVAAMISGIGVMLTLGKLICGQVIDRIGGRRSSTLFFGLLLAGHILCCVCDPSAGVLTIANVLLLGIGYPIATIGPSTWAAELVSRENYATVVRRLQISYSGGSLLFAVIPGVLADHFGDYIPAYLLFSALIVITAIFVRIAYGLRRQV